MKDVIKATKKLLMEARENWFKNFNEYGDSCKDRISDVITEIQLRIEFASSNGDSNMIGFSNEKTEISE